MLLYHRRPTFKCEDAINANAIFFPDSQLLNLQLTYYVCGYYESRRAQNVVIEFAISLKMRKHNVGLRYIPLTNGHAGGTCAVGSTITTPVGSLLTRA